MYHHNIQYSIKSAEDITISDNIKTHEKRITINTRKKSRKGNGKINGTYQLSIFPDNISTLFISRRGTKKYLSFDDFVTIGEGKIDRINQETIHYLKMISGEIPIEGLSNRVNNYIKALDKVEIAIPKTLQKQKKNY